MHNPGWDENGKRKYSDPNPMVTKWYCLSCGQWNVCERIEHKCQPDVYFAHQRESVEGEFGIFLRSNTGKFAQFLATRDILSLYTDPPVMGE